LKIRIQGDAIRLRLNRIEVASFAVTGRVESVIHFPGSSLCYALELDAAAAVPEADYAPGTIRIRVPARIAAEWAAGDEVALRGVQAVPNGPQLEILVEKDFQCLHKGEAAKDPEAYPNPAAIPSGA
jgi:hypothetical protein